MTYPTKIATCCYCGTRAALTLGGDASHHELVCANCGAPLHELKMLRKPQKPEKTRARRAAPHPGAAPLGVASMARPKPRKVKKKAKRKSKRMSKIWDEAFDLIEDIFD